MKHDFKKAMGYSGLLIRKPPNQQTTTYCRSMKVILPTQELQSAWKTY